MADVNPLTAAISNEGGEKMTHYQSESRGVDDETPAVEFIGYLQGLLQKLPEQSRADAKMTVRALLHLTTNETPPHLSVSIGVQISSSEPLS